MVFTAQLMRIFSLVMGLTLSVLSHAATYPLQAGDTRYAMPFGDAPVVIVMHGNSQDADRYLHQWRDLSDQYGFFLLVPEFSKANHPKSRQYHLGNVIDNNDRIRDRADWNFSRVELAFDYYRRKAGIQTNTYELYGHSAGSQFVHRPSLPFASIQSDGSGCRGTLLVWSSSLDLIDKIRA